MEQTARRAGSGGPAFIRLLARLTATHVPESGQPLSDQLGQWLTWTDAVALSAVLGEGRPVVKATAREDDDPARDVARLRADLTNAIVHDGVFAPAKPSGTKRPPPVAMSAPAADAEPEYAVYRQRYLALQQTMETGIGNLRSRLRGMLAARASEARTPDARMPDFAGLALVDAVMERSLGARERVLLTSVPRLLEKHFDQLRQAAQAGADAQAASAATVPPAWLETFRTHMQQVLLAELDVRLQPVEGVLAALQSR
ncbi:Protein of uncharacterised function (DUF3348) [Bordetella ansorpii]|uniref:Protein of uncharacterized function (DUF3348) n=1 Tax=Bordetella ansorpii TaxID=288768 RepID=A0A157P6U6_9BORD|nr:DUF3348 domain-containing protein [Bordetella ansorpii]SAI29151.1 Protein of uncharacterised function (DUF3348) [Bordetella ansorpii]